MDKLSFINGVDLTEKQLDEVGALLLETGYYEFTGKDNKLNLPVKEFFKRQIIEPYKQYVYALVNAASQVIGFFLAGTKTEIFSVYDTTANWRRDDPKLLAELKKVGEFFNNETVDTDFLGCNMAIAKVYRGQGYYKILHHKLIELAKSQHCQRIVFAVLNSYAAIEVYKHYSATIFGEIDSPDYFKDKMLKCYFMLSE